MDLLNFDAKKGAHRDNAVPVALDPQELHQLFGGREILAFLNGGLVQIFDCHVAQVLHEIAGIGQFMEDEREERASVSKACFTGENGEFHVESAQKWQELTPSVNPLILFPEETVLLSIEWNLLTIKMNEKVMENEEIWRKMEELSGNSDFGKRYAVYRHLKLNGWIVKSGATFGCDFLIYCLGAQYYHSSAGVLIADVLPPLRLLTLSRILSHNKKALMVATCPPIQRFDDVANVEVSVATMKTFFLERDVPTMCNKNNEVYELKKS